MGIPLPKLGLDSANEESADEEEEEEETSAKNTFLYLICPMFFDGRGRRHFISSFFSPKEWVILQSDELRLKSQFYHWASSVILCASGFSSVYWE